MNVLFASFPTSQGNTDIEFQHGPLCMSVSLIIFMRNGTHTYTHHATINDTAYLYMFNLFIYLLN